MTRDDRRFLLYAALVGTGKCTDASIESGRIYARAGELLRDYEEPGRVVQEAARGRVPAPKPPLGETVGMDAESHRHDEPYDHGAIDHGDHVHKDALVVAADPSHFADILCRGAVRRYEDISIAEPCCCQSLLHIMDMTAYDWGVAHDCENHAQVDVGLWWRQLSEKHRQGWVAGCLEVIAASAEGNDVPEPPGNEG